MKTMGFVISKKNNEKRRALIPEDLKRIKNVSNIFIEKGYGESLGFNDSIYIKKGANVVSREIVLNCDIIIDVKLGDADYLEGISKEKILIGWAHAAQDTLFTDLILNMNHTVIAWEEMYENGKYVFYRNREIAGEAAILHAYTYCGKLPYETRVAMLGNGQTAKGALRILHGLGANVDVYGRNLEDSFKKNMGNYDVLVNCVLWDTNRKDRIIYKKDLSRLSKGTMIIDVSCNQNLEIETSRPTTIDNPVYSVDEVIHYAVDNTPAMFPHSVTNVLSRVFTQYIDDIIEGNNIETIEKAVIIKKGHILDDNIRKFRETRNKFVK